MLAAINNYWFVAIPTLVTGFVLLHKLQQIREEAAARSLVPATIARNKIASKK